jgi:hypothetical protein
VFLVSGSYLESKLASDGKLNAFFSNIIIGTRARALFQPHRLFLSFLG